MVPHSLQSLILSLTGTTSLGDSGPSTNRTWCFTPRNPLFFRRRAPRPRDPAAFGEPDVVLHSPQVLILSSPSTTSLGPSGPPASRTWCFTARKPLFLRPARAQRAFGEPDVVLHSPQSLILSSPGTTSPGPSGPPANRTWCFTLRKPLFFRHRAPRPSGPVGLRQCRRGASLPAKPYSFVHGHHVSRAQQAFGNADVVLHSPQSLIPSSTGTTSLGPSGPPANRTWCFTLRKPLFFRHRAPRPSGPVGLRQCGRGASRLAIHYSFVRGHHVHEIRRPTGSRR